MLQHQINTAPTVLESKVFFVDGLKDFVYKFIAASAMRLLYKTVWKQQLRIS